jgi:hypothetical protein
MVSALFSHFSGQVNAPVAGNVAVGIVSVTISNCFDIFALFAVAMVLPRVIRALFCNIILLMLIKTRVLAANSLRTPENRNEMGACQQAVVCWLLFGGQNVRLALSSVKNV